MKAFVITIKDLPESIESAERTKQTGSKVGIKVENHWAITPADDPLALLAAEGIDHRFFEEEYSRKLNCISAFLSHHSLWKKCLGDPDGGRYLILEHDAVFVDFFPTRAQYSHICNFGKPSYGKLKQPMSLGINSLMSKEYFGGAHAYGITSAGAFELITRAQHSAAPTDLFMHNSRFPGMLTEYYPWPIEARDSFTTIQKVSGCMAKHNFNEKYRVV